MQLDRPTDLPTALAAERQDRLRRDAARDRLVALARCCRPSLLLRAASRAAAWLRAGQLGPADNYCACP